MSDERGSVRTEPAHKRIRVFLGGEPVVDTVDALYVWESPWYPQYYLPVTDFTDGALEPSATTDRSPSRGTATYFHVQGGNAKALDAAWAYADSPLEDLRGRVRLDWDAMDAWFEEDEEVFVHPRSPSTRVQILRSSRHVVVEVDGVAVADTNRPTFLFETGLPQRTYIPKLDVRMDLLTSTPSITACPYKGWASYWSVQIDGTQHADLAWSYRTALPESAAIAGLVAFYDELVDVTVDGQRQVRPRTKFAR